MLLPRLLFVVAAAAMAPGTARGGQQPDAAACPPPADCHIDYTPSACGGPKECSSQNVMVVACKWDCNDNNLPDRCHLREKPCSGWACDEPMCEIVCPLLGPCEAAQLL